MRASGYCGALFLRYLDILWTEANNAVWMAPKRVVQLKKINVKFLQLHERKKKKKNIYSPPFQSWSCPWCPWSLFTSGPCECRMTNTASQKPHRTCAVPLTSPLTRYSLSERWWQWNGTWLARKLIGCSGHVTAGKQTSELALHYCILFLFSFSFFFLLQWSDVWGLVFLQGWDVGFYGYYLGVRMTFLVTYSIFLQARWLKNNPAIVVYGYIVFHKLHDI